MEIDRPYLLIGRYGPCPEHLREQFEGVMWRFRTGSLWRDIQQYGARQTVYHRFVQWAGQCVSSC